MIDHSKLLEILEYKDGKFYWRVKVAKKIIVGSEAGSINSQGYYTIGIFGQKYRRNRLVWFYHYGKWPINMLDHKDGNSNNDKIGNLREATNQQNQFNRVNRKGSTSNYKGVHWCKNLNKWIAKFTLNGKRTHIGVFTDELEAAKAYNNAVKDHQREYRKDIF